jgi:hypothetical protein
MEDFAQRHKAIRKAIVLFETRSCFEYRRNAIRIFWNAPRLNTSRRTQRALAIDRSITTEQRRS